MTILNDKDFAQALNQGDTLVVNVLDPEFFHNEHIPGSVNIPVQAIDFIEQIHDAAPDKAQKLIIYSAEQSCPAWQSAVKQLQEDGYTQVSAYSGGLTAWKKSGHAEVSDIPALTPKEEAAQTGGELYTETKARGAA